MQRRTRDDVNQRLRRLTSRRAVLGAGIACGAAGILGTTAQPAAAALPPSPQFDLSGPAVPFFAPNRPLFASHHVMQSIAVDDRNRRMFILQQRNGSSGDDLVVNQLDVDGNVTGSMQVPDAGHGVSFGVEPVGSRSFIWMEADSNVPTNDGRGTALQRFVFEDGKPPRGVLKYWTGSDNVTCSIDPVYQRMLVRRIEDGRMRFRGYDLDAAARGDFGRPLVEMWMPDGVTGVGQGYAFLGHYLYFWTGSGHTDPADIDSTMWCIDLNTARIVASQVITVGADLVYREPEGVAAHRDRTGKLQLLFGFGSRDGQDRFASVFALDALVSG